MSEAGAGPVVGFDPFSHDVLADPYPYYEWLRSYEPVYHVPGTDIWVVSRHADVRAVTRAPDVFSSTGGVGPRWERHPMMSMYDPPEHTRLRRLVAKHFTPRAVASLAPRLYERTSRLFEDFLDRKIGDLVTDFAEPLVAGLIADVLGVPPERHGDFRQWSQGVVAGFAGGLGAEAHAAAALATTEFVAFLKEMIAARRVSASRSDLIGLLLSANESEALTRSELTAFCVLLLVAGFETTVNGIVNGAHLLLSNRAAWVEVVADPSLAPSLIDEALRLDPPAQAFFRDTRADAVLAGGAIPGRSKVMVLFASANRDERSFDRPNEFLLRRDASANMSFGDGVHYCLGAPLARLQFEVLVGVARTKLGSMRLASSPTRTRNALLRGFRHLPVSVRRV